MTKEEVQSIITNDFFVNLMLAAQDDENLRNKLLSALRSDDISREQQIREWVSSSINKGAPKQFVEALSYLAHKEIAHAAT